MSIDPEFAIKKDIRNNPILRGVDPAERRDYWRTVWLAGLIVGMLLFWAWQHFEILRNGYAVEKLRNEQTAETAKGRQLKLELKMWKSPQSIEHRAMSELHLQPATPADTIVIERVVTSTPSKTIVAAVR